MDLSIILKKDKFQNCFFCIVFFVLGFISYSNIFQSPFIFDDLANIKENKSFRITELSVDSLSAASFETLCKTRPVANVTFALNYYFHQYNTPGYHLVNILIHIITGILLFFLFKYTLEIYIGKDDNNNNQVIAFAAAMLWFVNPVQTQAVTYIVQRMTSMAAMFYILAVLMYVKGRLADENKERYCYFVICFIAALLAFGSKEISATLPVVILMYEVYFFRDLDLSFLKRNYIYVLCISVVLLIITLIFLGDAPFERIYAGYLKRDFTLPQRVMTEFRVVIYYLSLLFFPHPSRLNLDYDYPLSYSLLNPVTTVFCLALIICLIIVALKFAKKERLISFGILWYFGNLVIESSFIGLEIIFEHRMYLPSMFLFLAVTVKAYQICKIKHIRVIAITGVALICAFWAFERNKVWSTDLTLWKDCALKSPDDARVHNNLGLAYKNIADWDKAIEHYEKVLNLDPDYDEVLNNIAVALFNVGETKKAEFYIKKAIEKNPLDYVAYNNYGNFYAQQNKFKTALLYFRKSLELVPSGLDANKNLKDTLKNIDIIKKNITELNNELSMKPEDPAVLYKIGLYYIRLEEFDKTIDYMERAIKSQPVFPQALLKLASIHIDKSEFNKAADYFIRLYEIKPDSSKISYNIACLYGKQNKTEQAAKWLKISLSNGYDNWENIKNDKDLECIRNSKLYKKIDNKGSR